MKIIVTGGAGFIGSTLIKQLIHNTDWHVINVDSLTYAGHLASLNSVCQNPRYQFHQIDICDRQSITALFQAEKPDLIAHLAAESHVDRSIDGPRPFYETNVMGTLTLLEAFRDLWWQATDAKRQDMRFVHISTDEVFGSLGKTGFFDEQSPYDPRSPYAASKAASDHMVRAWHHTYGLPTIITNCSNNYGPYQFPEKLIPLMILNAYEAKRLPVYGNGSHVRDWLYVEDHARALELVLKRGRIGETYAIGGQNEHSNLEVVEQLCDILDRLAPEPKIGPRRDLIQFVKDRPGHDARYAISPTKIRTELGWQPQETFESGLEKTVAWCIAERQEWYHMIEEHIYQRQRLGVQDATT